MQLWCSISRKALLLCALLPVMVSAKASPSAKAPATSGVLCITQQAQMGSCQVPAAALAAGRKSFDEGMKLEKQGQSAAALQQMEDAADKVPQSIEFTTAREVIRQRLVFQHVQTGTDLTAQGHLVEAAAEYQTALSIDPDNIFAKERLTETMAPEPVAKRLPPQLIEDRGVLQVEPSAERHEFHLKGDSNDLLTRIAATYGMSVVLDENVKGRPIRFDLDATDFYTTMHVLGQMTKTFWTPLDRNQIYIAPESDQNHKLYDRMVYRTFSLPGMPAQEINDLISALKTILELKFVTAEPAEETLSVRGPQRSMEAVQQLVEEAGVGRPQLVLDVQILEVSGDFTRRLGLNASPQFTLHNIPPSALAGLLGAGSQDLLNQLLQSGVNSQAGMAALAALLAQQQGQQNSLFSQPLATFGGGATLFGLSLPSAGLNFSVSKSDVRSLTRSTLRAAQGDTASLHIGSRYPVLTSSYTANFGNLPVSGLFSSGVVSAPPPSVNFEDLGLVVKVKPYVQAGDEVTMEMELELKALGPVSLNGIPVISNRQYKGTIRLAEGEPALMTGMVTSSEQKGYNGVPFLGELPLLKELTSNSSREETDNEILVLVTPHVIREGNTNAGREVYLTPAR